jgi:exodeoxyribonuclease VII large subunit
MRLAEGTIGGEKVYRVSEITTSIKNLLETEFTYIWIVGEVSNCTTHSSGHTYFTLKDDVAQIRCVLFSGSSRKMSVLPQDGLKIYAQGRITVYERQGQYELIVNTVMPVGKGELYVAFNRLKEKLGKEGLFDASRKKDLPRFPSRLGVVTSPTGAAVRDLIRIATKIYAGIEIFIYPVKVQGLGAREEIAAAIEDLNSWGNVEIIVLARGGGSIEDLWAFNEEIVARAIGKSAIPVVSAVGHEIDFTIADFVADKRAATPSAAPSITLSGYVDVEVRMESLLRQASGALVSRLDSQKSFLSSLRTRYGLRRVKDRLVTEMRNVDEAVLDAERQLNSRLEAEAGRLSNLVGKVESLNPLSTLKRGYSVCLKDETGEIIKTYKQIIAGDRIRVRFAEGGAFCSVEETREEMS